MVEVRCLLKSSHLNRLNAPLKSTFLWFFRSPVSEIRQKAYYSLCNFVSVKVSSLGLLGVQNNGIQLYCFGVMISSLVLKPSFTLVLSLVRMHISKSWGCQFCVRLDENSLPPRSIKLIIFRVTVFQRIKRLTLKSREPTKAFKFSDWCLLGVNWRISHSHY